MVVQQEGIIPYRKKVDETDRASVYQKITASLPDDYFATGMLNLAKVLGWAGKEKEKLAILNRNSNKLDGHFEAQTNIGRIYFIKRESEKAKQEYKKAIELKPDYPHAHEGLAVVYHSQGNYDRAIEELKHALRLNPNYAEAYFNLGLIYLEQSKIDDAVLNFQKAVDCEPLYADAYSSLGVSYFQKREIDNALKYLNRAIQIDPNLAKAHNNLAIAYHTTGQYDLAWKHLEIAKKLNYKVHPEFIEMLKKDSEQ